MFWTITIADIIGYVLTIIIALIAVNKIINNDKSRTKTTQKRNTVGGDMVGRDKYGK